MTREMHKWTLIAFLYCWCLALLGQKTFSRQYDLVAGDLAAEIWLQDSLIHVFGFSTKFSGGRDEMHLILGPEGEQLHAGPLSDSSQLFEIARGLVDQGGALYFRQNHYNYVRDTVNWDDFIVKYDKEKKEIVFEKRFGDSLRTESVFSMIFGPPDKLVSVGWEFDRDFYSTNADNSQVLLQCIDTLGQLQWRRAYVNEGTENHLGSAVTTTPDGGYLIAGLITIQYDPPPNQPGRRVFVYQALLIRTDSVGNEVQRIRDPDAIGDYARGFMDIITYSDSLYIAVGQQGHMSFLTEYASNIDSVSFYAVGLDQDLQPRWHIIHDTLHRAAWTRIRHGHDGNLILSGESARDKYSQDTTDYPIIGTKSFQGVLSLLSPEGELLWHRNYVSSPSSIRNSNFIYNVSPTPDGGYVAVGYAHTPVEQGRNQNMWVIKTDEYGCITRGCHEVVTSAEDPQPGTAHKIHAYPNPTSDRVRLEFNTGRLVSYKILSGTGQVMEDVQFIRPETVSQIDIHLADRPAGLYRIALRFERGWQVVPIVKVP